MKHILFLLISIMLLVSQSFAGDNTANLDKLRSLAGSWSGTKDDGKTVKVSYEVVSNGSAVMERIAGEGEPDMVSMYHMDGDQLIMTHYCAVANQPRMRAQSTSEDGVIAFKMFDITNLAKESDGHMAKLKITLKDADHMQHLWTFAKDGQEMDTTFKLTRDKMSKK